VVNCVLVTPEQLIIKIYNYYGMVTTQQLTFLTFSCYGVTTTQITTFVPLYSSNNITLKMAAIADETFW